MNGPQGPESSTEGAVTATASEGDLAGDLAGLTVVCNGECLVVHDAPEAPVPMEVDPTAGNSLPGDIELGVPDFLCSGSSWGAGPWPATFGSHA